MTNDEIARAIAVEINAAELALAKANALATDAFRASLDPVLVADIEKKHERSVRAVNILHGALNKALKASGGVISPRSGGGK